MRSDTDDSTALRERLLDDINAGWRAQAIGVASVLGLPECLAQGPRTADGIAQACGSHGPSTRRLLRALATLGVVHEGDDGRYALAPGGRLLLPDEPQSLHAWARQRHASWAGWGELLLSVRTGIGLRERRSGRPGFAELGEDSAAASQFHRAIGELTARVVPAVVRTLELSGMEQVLDVGGGSGELLAALALAHPRLEGRVLDLVHARASASSRFEAAGLGDRCGFVEGSFFDPLPAGAQLLLLKSVLHNWNDERGLCILLRCRQALAEPGARLAIVERVAAERLGDNAADRELAASDLNMLAHLSGRERTQAELDGLLDAAGLRAPPAVPLAAGFSLIEARVRG